MLHRYGVSPGSNQLPMGRCVEDLVQDLLLRVFAFMDCDDICHARQCCRFWRETGHEEILWLTKARQLWPERTLLLGTYTSYQELVADSNKVNATCVVGLEGKASIYKYSVPESYYECKLLSMQWCRQEDELRVFFDARGEEDLRAPSLSSIALATHVPFGMPFTSEHFIASIMPKSCHLLVEEPGHFKGYLVYPGVAAMSSLLSELSIPSKLIGRMAHRGLGLYFVYGNKFPVETCEKEFKWGPQFVDYEPVSMLKVPVSATLEQAVYNSCVYELPSEPARKLATEPDERQRERWQDIPQEVLGRPGVHWVPEELLEQ